MRSRVWDKVILLGMGAFGSWPCNRHRPVSAYGFRDLATGGAGAALAAVIFGCPLHHRCIFSMTLKLPWCKPDSERLTQKGCLWLTESRWGLNSQTTHHEKDKDAAGLRRCWNQELQCSLSVCHLLLLFPCDLAPFLFALPTVFIKW